MLKNSSKMIFIFSMIFGTFIVISSNSWLSAWMGLEINLLSFIPLMISINNLMSTEATLKYFLTQALASSMFLFSIIMFMYLININNYMIININSLMLMINSTLLIKLGAAPFHFWFPGVMEGLNWINNLILMTWQKIAPFMLISYLINNFLMWIMIISVMIGSIGGLNQTSMRKIMAFSSINHLGWMLAAMLFNENLWQIYFLIYSFLTLNLIMIFNSFKIFHINHAFSMFQNLPLIKFMMFMSLLSLGGLPPFLGFLPKWFIIQSMTTLNYYFMITLMVIFTLLTLFYYMRICYSSFMLNNWEISWNFKSNYNSLNLKILMTFSFFSIFGLILINFIYMY